MSWLGMNATEFEDREHVTTLVNKWHQTKSFDFPFTLLHVLQDCDESELHTSIDTEEDYKNALDMIDRIKKKKQEAIETGVFIL
jgi:spore coat polysaccharide biosynthesis protein SpsF (cytidylyltransferase family)